MSAAELWEEVQSIDQNQLLTRCSHRFLRAIYGTWYDSTRYKTIQLVGGRLGRELIFWWFFLQRVFLPVGKFPDLRYGLQPVVLVANKVYFFYLIIKFDASNYSLWRKDILGVVLVQNKTKGILLEKRWKIKYKIRSQAMGEKIKIDAMARIIGLCLEY